MVANGTNYRMDMYNPDTLAPILYDISNKLPGYTYSYLMPFKKVLRDTKINQYTIYFEMLSEAEDVNIGINIDLVRVIANTEGGPFVSRDIGKPVLGSIATAVLQTGSVGPFTQHTLNSTLVLEGGTYWLRVRFATSEGTDKKIVTIISRGVTDTDALMLYPKYEWESTGQSGNTNIDIQWLTRNTTNWMYGTAEWQ